MATSARGHNIPAPSSAGDTTPQVVALGMPIVVATPKQRLYVALRQGATVSAAASRAGVSLPMAEVMIDEMQRQGLLERAESLCSSGLGVCGGGTSDEVKVHCAGCPLI